MTGEGLTRCLARGPCGADSRCSRGMLFPSGPPCLSSSPVIRDYSACTEIASLLVGGVHSFSKCAWLACLQEALAAVHTVQGAPGPSPMSACGWQAEARSPRSATSSSSTPVNVFPYAAKGTGQRLN